MLAIRQRLPTVRQAGVTLVELAIVLAIVGVLAVATLPSIVDRWQRETVILFAERFASAASLARATAQYRHVQTNLGPRDRALGWASGWKLTTSRAASNPDRTSAPVEQTTLLCVAPPMVPAVHFSSTIRGGTLSYAPVGYSRNSNGGPRYGTLTISSGRHVRQVRVNNVGRARICNPATDGPTCTFAGDDDADP